MGRPPGALILTALFLVAEVVGGLLSNSLTLLADAGHMFTDVGALAFSLFVVWLARRPATSRNSYGYLRWEILAALLNGAVLLAVSAGIVWEAVHRLRAPEPVKTSVMFVVGAAGLVVNAMAARMLHAGSGHSINVRAAYLHVLSDLLGSAAAVIAALLIRYRGWAIADPVASLVMTLLIVRSSWALVRESVDVLLEATPAHIDLDAVRASLQDVSGVESVHDLHVLDPHLRRRRHERARAGAGGRGAPGRTRGDDPGRRHARDPPRDHPAGGDDARGVRAGLLNSKDPRTSFP